ncbi:nuclear elongation and deformation protein [Plectosphaerella plurivora]|uniref:Nuclear elongation and deformation protein n=1 Tax=Plectosphaerella plurivora TaxID=936078 RepID=A0A9P8VI89_9PEZI|nr:nuclear elongation and deformation protein [Plectosphaerella plurivora]
MQYVRNLSDSVSSAWNSINPATLSGAIDVIVVEQEDGSLVCSPFHVRFGKFSLLRPYEKKVEFHVNGVKQPYAMKLGEEGEAFFVFETSDNIPKDMQTSPLVSPASSPPLDPETGSLPGLQEPDLLDLDEAARRPRRPPPAVVYSTSASRDNGLVSPLSTSPELSHGRPKSGDWSSLRPHSDDVLRTSARTSDRGFGGDDAADPSSPDFSERSHSPPPLATSEAIERAINLSKHLSAAKIPCEVNEAGDLKLDMSSFKNSEEDIFRAEIMARKVLAQELDGNYDIGALFGMDEHGNIWIYSSEESKEAAQKRTLEIGLGRSSTAIAADAASDPGYQSDASDATTGGRMTSVSHRRAESDGGIQTPPSTPPTSAIGSNPNRNYAKTLRLTSDQLKALELKHGANSMSFTVNRATCQANMFLWKHETPVIISDIDGTITKSDALGHVLNMIGRDWTHAGVAKLYCDIVANGYNIMYLTSRSVGQSDSTRAYLAGVVQDGYRLPKGPTILSPDRTMAALRREVYLRKPHVFKMATLRDIRALYGPDRRPFYAGYGNRLTDQISYRTVDVPSYRIFTINSNAEVSLDLLTLNKLKMTYININEVVDHFFPPVSTLVKGGEEYTDFQYWRDQPLELDEFSASDSEDDDEDDEDEDEGAVDGMMDSYISRDSMDGSVMSESVDGGLGDSRVLDDTDADGEDEDEEEYDDEDEDNDEDDDDDDDRTQEIADLRSQREGTARPESKASQTKTVQGDGPASSRSSSPASVRHAPLRKELTEDVSAELITGVKHLTLEKTRRG